MVHQHEDLCNLSHHVFSDNLQLPVKWMGQDISVFSRYTSDNSWYSGYLNLRSIHDWIGLSSVLRPLQHSIGYMGDGYYRSKDPTNSIKVLKELAVKEKPPKQRKHKLHMHTHTK